MFTFSLFSKISTLPLKLVFLTIQYFTIRTVFDDELTRKSLKRTISLAIFQHMTKGLRLSDIHQYAMYSVTDLLVKLSSSINCNHKLPGYGEIYTVRDESYCISSWLVKQPDRKSEDPILLYVHGGCFAIHLQDIAVEALADFYKALKDYYGKEISIIIVDYSLTSNGYLYLNSIMKLEKYMTNLLKKLQYLQHKTISDVIWPSGVIIISPWLDVSDVKFEGSYKQNHSKDVFSFQAVDYFGKEYINHDLSLNDSSLVNINKNGNKVDWKGNPTIKNGKILVIFGEYEVLKDEILKWYMNTDFVEYYPQRILLDPEGVHIGLN